MVVVMVVAAATAAARAGWRPAAAASKLEDLDEDRLLVAESELPTELPPKVKSLVILLPLARSAVLTLTALAVVSHCRQCDSAGARHTEKQECLARWNSRLHS